jgi:hypothetical protein
MGICNVAKRCASVITDELAPIRLPSFTTAHIHRIVSLGGSPSLMNSTRYCGCRAYCDKMNPLTDDGRVMLLHA